MTLDRDVIEDVRIACERSGRPTDEAEIRRALEELSSDELDALHRIARSPLAAKPLGPDALVDIVRGVPPMKAAARELGGYYELKAERDALANIARHGHGAEAAPPLLAEEEEPELEEEPEEEPPPPDALAAEPAAKRRRSAAGIDAAAAEQQRQALMTLFAYHRDAVRVAQELGIGLMELNERIEALGLKRQIHRLLELTTDIDAFRPERLAVPKTGKPTPVVRRRSERAATLAAEEQTQEQQEETEQEVSTPPVANTSPVNIHGTRVYRRAPLAQSASESSAGLALRREYVREVRRQARQVRAPAPAAKVPEAPKPPPKRPFSELQGPGGAAILERLLADEKANPRVLAGKLAERFEGPADRQVSESDLRALLQYHGLAETFREREITNTRFLIGFHQGARGKLANALLMSPEELVVYLGRLGLTEELEKTRAERARIEIGRRRMSDRLVQVLTRAPYLDDLGVLGVIDREVREHLEQLFAKHTGSDAAEQVRVELGVEKNPFAKLLRRYQLEGKLEAGA